MPEDKPPLPRRFHDGSWAIQQRPPYKRINWENHHRERTISLFGLEFYRKEMLKRVRRYLHEHT